MLLQQLLLLLSTDFNNYVIKNPSTTARVVSGSTIVLGTERNQKLTEVNRELGEKMAKKGKRVYIATKAKKKWTVKPLKTVSKK